MPCFIMAEAGVNHNGSVQRARSLVDAAVSAGADAIKFQSFHAERLVTRDAVKADYQTATTGDAESQYQMLKKLELSTEDHHVLFKYCRDKNILFLSTPFDEQNADLLFDLGVGAFKIGSGDVTNLPLLRYVAAKQRPVIMSSGMSTMADVRAAFTAMQDSGCRELALLHCVSSYPADPADVNLRAMRELAHTFNIPCGFSDHTLGHDIALAAVALGACILEKHLTLDHALPGPDHACSLEPDEMAQLVKAVRDVEAALGDGCKKPTAAECALGAVARRSITTACNIPRGFVVKIDDLVMRRPGTGLPPSSLSAVIGRRARIDIAEDTLISMDMLE